MSQHKQDTIQQKVDHLFEQEGDERRDDLNALLQRIVSYRDEASRSFRRNVSLFLVTWAVSFLIGSGLVQEVQVTPVKIIRVDALLIGAPVLLAIFAYLMSIALVSSIVYGYCVRQFYKHLLPTIKSTKLGFSIAAPTFWNIEMLLEPHESNKLLSAVSNAWRVLIISLVTLIPFFAIVHVCYLFWESGYWSFWPCLVSTAISGVMMLRSIFVFIQGYKISV